MAAEQTVGGYRRARLWVPESLASTSGSVGKFVRRKPLGAFGALVTVLLVLVAIFADIIAPYGSLTHSAETLQGPSAQHWLGTDQFGRDVLSRIIHGARVSLLVASGSRCWGRFLRCYSASRVPTSEAGSTTPSSDSWMRSSPFRTSSCSSRSWLSWAPA